MARTNLSLASKLEFAQGTAERKKIKPYHNLSAVELEYFEIIIDSRASDLWTRADVVAAGNLAIAYRRMDEANEQLDREGYTQTNPRGTEVAHPLFSVVVQLNSVVLSLTRVLGLSASQRSEGSADQKGKHAGNAAAVATKAAAKGSLLATPE